MIRVDNTGAHRFSRRTCHATWSASWAGWPSAAGSSRPGDYYLDEEILAGAPVEKFNLLLIQGELAHWHEFSPGVDGFITMVMQKTGLKGLKGKGKTAMKTTLKAWSKIFRVDIRFGGKDKNATAGLVERDEISAWLFGDPNDEIEGSYSCATGGTLAIGGPFVSSTGVAHSATGSGGNRSYFWDATEGDVVFQDGIECKFVRSGARGPNDDLIAQVGAHEVGHALGLDHSCGDDDSGPCNTKKKDDALMRASLHGDGRGAAIKKDDKNGAKALDYSG